MGGELSLFRDGPWLLLGPLLGVRDRLLWLEALNASHLLIRCFLWYISLSLDADRLLLSLLSSLCRCTSIASLFLLLSSLCFGFVLTGDGDESERESDLLLFFLLVILSFDLDLLCLSCDLDLRDFSGRFALCVLSLDLERFLLVLSCDRDLLFLSCDLDLLLLWALSRGPDCRPLSLERDLEWSCFLWLDF